jgi:Tol biopolymer transport system component
MSSDGTGQVRLTHTPTDERRPVWSPDGSWIAYLRCGNTCAAFVIRPDGRGGAKRLGGTADFRSRISWSPDGKAVVFDDGASVIESDLVGGRTQGVAEGTQPAWSPVS